MGGRWSPQALSPIVERVPTEVLVDSETTDAASVAARRWRRATTEDRIVLAAAAAFHGTATHQRRNRWHWLAAPQGGKVASTDSVPPLEQISGVIVPVVIVKGILGGEKMEY